MLNKLLIAIDFDGTIVDDAYPEVGKPKIFAFDTMKRLQDEGHRLILWTYRHGTKLDEAVAFCAANGVEFYAINNTFPSEEFEGKESRKIGADVFIDDRNIGGFLGWGEIYQLLVKEEAPKKTSKKKKGIFSFLRNSLND